MRRVREKHGRPAAAVVVGVMAVADTVAAGVTAAAVSEEAAGTSQPA